MCELWPWRNLSSGGTITEDAKEVGIGVGVTHRVNGLEEVVDEEPFDVLDSMELLLSVLDWRDLRRKGTEGIR